MIGTTPREVARAVSWPRYPRRLGLSAIPLSVNNRCGIPLGCDPFPEDSDSGLRVLAGSDQGSDSEAGVVVLELEDHTTASLGQDIAGGIELPACVRGGVDEAAVCRAGFLFRLCADLVTLAENACQGRYRWWGHSHLGHFVVYRDRAAIEAGLFQSESDSDC